MESKNKKDSKSISLVAFNIDGAEVLQNITHRFNLSPLFYMCKSFFFIGINLYMYIMYSYCLAFLGHCVYFVCTVFTF